MDYIEFQQKVKQFAENVETAFQMRDEGISSIIEDLNRMTHIIAAQDKKIKELEDTISDIILTGAYEIDSK